MALSLLVVGCEAQPAPAPAASPSAVAAAAPKRSCDFAVGNREVLVTATRRAQLGLLFWPETLAVERNETGYVFYAGHRNTQLEAGFARTVGSLDDPVISVIPRIAVHDERAAYDGDYVTALYRDPKTQTLLAFSYTERHPHGNSTLFYGGVGMLKSTDNGLNWSQADRSLGRSGSWQPVRPGAMIQTYSI